MGDAVEHNRCTKHRRNAADDLRLAGAGQARGGVFGNGYIGKRTNLLLPDAKVGQVRAKSWGKLCKLRHNLPHDVKLPGFTIGERAKQQSEKSENSQRSMRSWRAIGRF